jgi:hypothetical protein
VSGPGKGGKRGYAWPPVEPGQAGAAHIATTHGGWSPALRDPVAAAIHEARMADPATPKWLKDDPSYLPELLELARVEALAQMIFDWLSRSELREALADVHEETEVARQEGPTRRTVRRATRTVAAAEQYRRYAAQASKMREGLGLTPIGRHRLAQMAESPQLDIMQLAAERFREVDKDKEAGS